MAPSKGGIAAWYNKFADFNIESLFVRKREPGPPRSIFINQQLPHDYYDKRGRVKKEHVFVTNQVVTSKFTLITFVPRNLLEQYRRIANMYVFLFLVVLPVLHPRHRLLYAITLKTLCLPVSSMPSQSSNSSLSSAQSAQVSCSSQSSSSFLPRPSRMVTKTLSVTSPILKSTSPKSASSMVEVGPTQIQ